MTAVLKQIEDQWGLVVTWVGRLALCAAFFYLKANYVTIEEYSKTKEEVVLLDKISSQLADRISYDQAYSHRLDALEDRQRTVEIQLAQARK